MPTIAMMTDFGIKDGNVGVLKGVIWGICPEAQIADLSHMIGPQDVREAALILARSAAFFPQDTIFLVVVDPGVGTNRRPMAARVGSHYFVGPDNGLITMWLEEARAGGLHAEFVALDRPEYWLPTVSHVFHGRDVFAPVAAHLARGIPISALGTAISDPVALDIPRPRAVDHGWEGEIIHVDHFGNAAANIRAENLGILAGQPEGVVVSIAGRRIEGMVRTFGDRPRGEIVALFGSTGNLIISVVNGSAADVLGIKVGDPIRVDYSHATGARQ